MPHALRLAALLTLLLGLGGIAVNRLRVPPFSTVHLILGVITVVLALVVLGPELRAGFGGSVGAWFALIPLVIGLLWWRGVWAELLGRIAFVALIVHALFGLAAIGLIEMGLARRKRRLAVAQHA